MWPVVVLLPVAWLTGTFPSALLVARARGADITREGSGNPGTSNVIRVLGWRAGDGLAVGGRAGAHALGLAAVLGHTFPLYRRKGGKGVAAAGGWLLVTFPVVAVVLAAVWVLVVAATRKASLGSIVITVLFPPFAALLGYRGVEVALLCAIAVFVLVRHAGNISRLVHRREHDLFARHDGEAQT
jgi:glycerol-3-phosphate acyltransferase PlsY